MNTYSRKLVLKMSMSIDGFVAGPDGEMAWMFRYMSAEGASWLLNEFAGAGLHLMGSRTFYDMANWWPYSDEALAEPMNRIPKAVFSRNGVKLSDHASLTTRAIQDAMEVMPVDRPGEKQQDSKNLESWRKAAVYTGQLASEIRALKQLPGSFLLAHGGASFAQSLVKSGLIDEFWLLLHPVALGRGLSLFPEMDAGLYLELISSKTFSNGTEARKYRPVRQ